MKEMRKNMKSSATTESDQAEFELDTPTYVCTTTETPTC